MGLQNPCKKQYRVHVVVSWASPGVSWGFRIHCKKQYRVHVVVFRGTSGVSWGLSGVTNSLQKTIQDARRGFWAHHWDFFWVQHGPRVVSDASRHARDGLRQVRHGPRNLQGGPRRLSDGSRQAQESSKEARDGSPRAQYRPKTGTIQAQHTSRTLWKWIQAGPGYSKILKNQMLFKVLGIQAFRETFNT